MSVTALTLGTAGYLLFRDKLNRTDGPPLIRRLNLVAE